MHAYRMSAILTTKTAPKGVKYAPMGIKLNIRSENQGVSSSEVCRSYSNIPEKAEDVQEDLSQYELVLLLVGRSELCYEVPTLRGKKNSCSHWMPFVLDKKTTQALKQFEKAYRFLDKEDEQPLFRVGKRRPPFSPDLIQGLGTKDKLWVNLLSVHGFDLAVSLWEKEADMKKSFGQWLQEERKKVAERKK